MFLHINTFGKQISLHAKDAQLAQDEVPEVKDEEGNVAQAHVPAVDAKPAEPLKNVIEEAMAYWEQKDPPDWAAIADGKRLNVKKTPLENGLRENDYVSAVKQEDLDADVQAKQEALDNAKRLATPV